MSSSAFGVATAMWTIDKQAAPTLPAVLRYGRHTIPVDDISGVRLREVRHWPVAGLAFGALFSIAVAVALAAGVFEWGMRERFLIGTAVLGVLGLFAMTELKFVAPLRHYEVEIRLKSGGSARFVSVDRGDVERLVARLSGNG